jgi:hypothetical protein
MNHEQVAIVLNRVRKVYPQFVLTDEVIDLWHDEFNTVSFEDMQFAVDHYIREGNEHAPRIPSIHKALKASALSKPIHSHYYEASPERRKAILSYYDYISEIKPDKFRNPKAISYQEWLDQKSFKPVATVQAEVTRDDMSDIPF